MRCSDFEHHLQLVTNQESNASSADASGGGGQVLLTEEQLLSWAFDEIGTHVQQISPSLEVEQRVMNVFDRELQSKQRYSHNWPRYAAAIAATVLIIAGLSLARWRHRTSPASIDSKSPIEFTAASAAVESLNVKPSSSDSRKKSPRSQRVSGLARNSVHRQPAASAGPASEITTDFIRINAAPIEPGDQIVRVQLPRSAMAQFGLPVNMDRSDKPVKADVIVGVDGVAQAIRFVQ